MKTSRMDGPMFTGARVEIASKSVPSGAERKRRCHSWSLGSLYTGHDTHQHTAMHTKLEGRTHTHAHKPKMLSAYRRASTRQRNAPSTDDTTVRVGRDGVLPSSISVEPADDQTVVSASA